MLAVRKGQSTQEYVECAGYTGAREHAGKLLEYASTRVRERASTHCHRQSQL